ncbi:MAG: tetratricopeptide repeat protein [Ekhidna sp.]|nr:tetratricopeptide repeat protein [Ekhidna sp.]
MRILSSLLIISSLVSQAQSIAVLDSLNEYSKSIVCVEPEKYDSIFRVVEKASRGQHLLTQFGDALIINAYAEQCKGDYRKAIEILRNALFQFREGKDFDGISRAMNQIAASKMRISEMDSAFHYSRQAYDFASLQGDSILLANCYLTMSSLHSAVSNNDSIIFYAFKGLEILGDREHDSLRGGLTIAIGGTYYQSEEFEKAIKYYKEAKQYFAEESMNMGRIYHNLGSAFTQIDQYDSSFHYFSITIPINRRLNRKLFLAYNYHSLAHNFAQAGNCDKSVDYNLLSLKISKEIDEIRSRSAVHANISECYVKTGQLGKAIENAEEALRLTKETGDVDKEADAYFLLSEAYRALGRYKDAYEAHKKFYSLDSMLLGRDRQSIIAGMEAKYESEKKEAEIASLSQQASIQALKIQQKNQILIIVLVSFLFLLATIYFFYKQREITNQKSQTELEQRFLRSQLNPHFISNALVAVQSFMLKNDTKSAAIYLTKFSKLMREILENSRREFITVEQEMDMLKNYLEIHQQRLGSFQYFIDLDEAIDPEVDTIPPMFVQPFLENAVEHGIGNISKDGKIDLKFRKEGDFIKIAVYDNGSGLHQKTKNNHKSLSTIIIRERMDLFNRTLKRKIQLVIDNLRNEDGEISGTKVELKVPFGI